MKKIASFIAAIAISCGITATAQEVDYTSAHNFVGLQAGGQVTMTHYKFTDLITPQYAIQFGRYFNDKVGARLHVMGFQNKTGFKASRYSNFGQPNGAQDKDFKFKACTADLDLLVNMTNVINPNRVSRAFDWVLLVGAGANYVWDYADLEAFSMSLPAYSYAYAPNCGTKHSSFNVRMGTQLNYNISEHFTVGLELQANNKNDVYNIKTNDKTDWQFVALAGVTYNFGYKHKAAPKPEPVVEEPAPAPAPAPEVKKEEPKPVVVKKEEPLKETIFYQIRLSDPSEAEATLNKIVAWCNEYPAKSITISGYADRGTGNAKLNKGYAEQRAIKVADSLKAKGISADRMSVNSYGDTVQPYADNDMNRCVIVVGE